MCEANVYINRAGKEELLMEKVDRVIPGEDDNIFMESIFGERKVVKARIKEMELVHHRIILNDITEVSMETVTEIWLEPETDHGHFHAGEEVRLKLLKGYNMRASETMNFNNPQAFAVNDGDIKDINIHDHHGSKEISLGEEADGLIQVCVREDEEKQLFAKLVIEIGHHHHHGLKPAGLPLEIVPLNYSHARMGENYEIQVLKDGQPWPGIEVKATYSGTHNRDYPHRLTTDDEGKTRLFLTAKGNYLFSVASEGMISTFTLVKSY